MSSTKAAGTVLVVLVVLTLPVAALPGTVDGDLDAHFTIERVLNEGVPGATNSTLVVDAPADDAVYVDSQSFDAATLAEIFDGEVVGDRVRVPLPPDGRIEADFQCVEIGDATFTVTGVDSGASDTASISVRGDLLTDVSFYETVLVAAPGDTVRVPISLGLDCESGETIRIVVGSREAGFRMSANVSVKRGAEDVALLMDLDRAGQTHPERYLSVHNATLVNATLHTLPRDRPLETGEYNLSLYRDGTEVDVALLFLREQTPTPTPTPSPTPSPTSTPTPTSSPTPPPTASPTPEATPTPGSTPQTEQPATVPGFGSVATVVATVLAALVAARRP